MTAGDGEDRARGQFHLAANGTIENASILREDCGGGCGALVFGSDLSRAGEDVGAVDQGERPDKAAILR